MRYYSKILLLNNLQQISQHWFRESERSVATTLMLMSTAAGGIAAFGITPLMVPTPDYIPIMNIVWFIPAALGLILCIYKESI